ncbi:hypothetical protein ACL6C3_27130 [Capilliphycus salinus ALCB114379]|uniref:hypothetical protein n=1 Tax=Capilliphycus salinus TaxID=2768948 RepID=UPI0039A743DB
MTEASEPQNNETISAQDIAELLEEYQQYRERLLNETLETAKRAKISQTATMARLEPELAKIDSVLEQLRQRQASLNPNT